MSKMNHLYIQEELEAEEERTQAMYDSFRNEGKVELIKELLHDVDTRLDFTPFDRSLLWMKGALNRMLQEYQAE